PIKDSEGHVIGASTVARDITQKRLAETALTIGFRQQNALFHLADALHRAESFDEIYDAGLDAISAALHCDRASILLYDKDQVMRFEKWRGLSDGYRRLTEGHSPWTPDAQRPTPICVNDVDQSDFPESLRSALQEEGIRALAFVPLVSTGRLI